MAASTIATELMGERVLIKGMFENDVKSGVRKEDVGAIAAAERRIV